MSSMGYLAFVVSVINSVVNAANNINSNNNNNNNNNNDNNNNNNNVNIQNSNNNQNNMNMVIAGRKIPIEKVLNLQNRLARHHKESEGKTMNQTIFNILDFNPVTKEQFNRTVILPLQPQLNRQQKQETENTEDSSEGFTNLFKHAVKKYFPNLLRKKRSFVDQEISNCNFSLQGEAMVAQSLQAVHIMLAMWVQFENKKVKLNKNLKIRHGIIQDLPTVEQFCRAVSDGAKSGKWAKLVTKKLAEGALKFWNIKAVGDGSLDIIHFCTDYVELKE